MDQGKYGATNKQHSTLLQKRYGKNDTWICPECETINTEDTCILCGYKNQQSLPGKRMWVKYIIALAAALLLAVGSMLLLGNRSQHVAGPAVSTATVKEKVAEDTWTDNVLMKDRAMEVIPLGGYRSSVGMNRVLGSDIMRLNICRVVFEDSTQNASDDCWDVSDAQNNSVLAWVIPSENNLYELHIAAEGGINGKIACEDLFCGYSNVTSIEFNNSFHTEEAEDLSRMFYGCWQLEKLDLSSIKTDSATNISEMFAHCEYLTAIDVSAFDTSNVEDTSGMFSSCRNLQSVDITGFNLSHVRDVSYMFYECPAGTGLQLVQDGFWFRNVDRYENFMDEGVLVDGEPWITLFEV